MGFGAPTLKPKPPVTKEKKDKCSYIRPNYFSRLVLDFLGNITFNQ